MTDSTPSQRAQHWLDQFGAALATNQPDAVLPLFDADCYWRDLVSFTWNIRTQEGHDADPRHAERAAWRTPAPRTSSSKARPPRPMA